MYRYYFIHILQFLISLSCVQSMKSEKLVGGPLSGACAIKYQVIIATNAEKFYCGGSIIDDMHVITAAHCVQKSNSVYGCRNLTVITERDSRDDDDFTEFQVDRAYIPAQFSEETTVGDIAVVRLSKPMNVTDNPCLAKLRLPVHDDYEETEAIVSGQGIEHIDWRIGLFKLEFDTNHTARLRTMRVKIVSNAECQKTYKFGFLKFMKIRDGMLCAVPLQSDEDEKLKGACDGDSGSPLVVNDTIVGIVSNGERFCDDVVYNGIYTRVYYYLDFLKKALNDDDNCTLIQGPSTDYTDLCLVKSDTYAADPRNLSFLADYDLLPFYSQGISDFFSYIKYTTIKVNDRFMSWWKEKF